MREMKKSIIVIGEGDSERHYFSQAGNVLRKKIIIKPELSKHPDYIFIIKKLEEIIKSTDYDYIDFIFCLIDLDDIKSKGKVTSYSEMKNKYNKNKKVFFLESFPSFEVWYLFHYCKYPGTLNDDYSVMQKLKNITYFNDYDKSDKFYSSKKVFNTLYPKLKEACSNAENSLRQPQNRTKTEIYKIFKRINECK